MSSIAFNDRAHSRITQGNETAYRHREQAVETELAAVAPDQTPSDQVSLRVRETDQGSGFFRKDFLTEVDDLDGDPNLKVKIELEGWLNKAFVVVTNSGDGGDTQVKIPVGRMNGGAYLTWFGPRGRLTEEMEQDGISAVVVDRDGGDARISMHHHNRVTEFTIGRSLTISSGMASDRVPSELS